MLSMAQPSQFPCQMVEQKQVKWGLCTGRDRNWWVAHPWRQFTQEPHDGSGSYSVSLQARFVSLSARKASASTWPRRLRVELAGTAAVASLLLRGAC